ncbi:universal stress protein [Vibrio sp. JC009]|uniref:universal stress protein n=1 Tax=Vibrio sp. JC009 TaxID=2912314 RepID=UPI0023AF2269|nr:universal stress protein [Vibrio sp. JC009]WED23766.1 universal stress protein [Vibrio sp. JC009]
MTYKHILVAVDLSSESHLLVEKAASQAKANQAKLSLIHIEVVQDDDFTRQIVNSLVEESAENKVLKESQDKLKELKDNASYPIENTLVACGGLDDELEKAIAEYEFDLIVCGHHQDFWHTVKSSTKQVMRSIPVDMLVVPLK